MASRPTGLYQLELKAFLIVMMDHMEVAYCQPGVPLDEERAFDRWMWRLKRGWRALKSPASAEGLTHDVISDLMS